MTPQNNQESHQRKAVENALRESEEAYHALFENINVGVYRNSGHNGRVIKANPAIARMFGYDSVDAYMKVSVADLYMNPEDRIAFLRELKEKGQVKNKELLLKKKDGSPMWALCTATIKYDENGDIQWIEGIIDDISRRKRAEELLRQNNMILRNILSASPVGIGLIENNTFSWANEEMIRMFGFRDKQEYKGKETYIIYSTKEEYDRVTKTIGEKLREKQQPEVDATFKRKDGKTFVGHLRLSCPDPSNPSKKAIFTIQDISWRMKAEEERIQKEKLHGVLEVAGAVCHEMNQPMQIISTYCHVLTKEIAENHESYEKVQKIVDQVHRMIEITKKLKGITRYETQDYLAGVKIIDIDKSAGTEE